MSSVLAGVCVDYILDHIRNMEMVRFPTEFDALFGEAFPHRCVTDGSGAMQMYYYILHGFLSADLSIMDDAIGSEELWKRCLPRATLHSADSDMIIHNFYDEHLVSEPNKLECLYERVLAALCKLKRGGFGFIEGIASNRVNYLHTTMSSLYLHPELCRIRIFASKPGGRWTVVVQKCFDVLPQTCEYLFAPVAKLQSPDEPSVLVLVTSAVKSKGNTTIFSERTRFRQLQLSIRSALQKIPNAFLVVSDVSRLDEDVLRREGVDAVVVHEELEGMPKSLCESLMMSSVFKRYIRDPTNPFGAVVKLSGRYVLTQNFVNYDPRVVTCKQTHTGRVMTRFLSVPRDLFGRFCDSLDVVCRLPELEQSTGDIEGVLGTYFRELVGSNVEALGVSGFFAVQGQLVVE